ncbi:unnamed protein product [Ectocarpus sp. 13 AM-2016]
MLSWDSEEFNFVGLARSPVKRTPRTYYDDDGAVIKTEEPFSGSTTDRMSTGSARSAGYSSVGPASSARHRQALHPMAENSVYTPAPPSALDSMVNIISTSISSNKKALTANRSGLPVSRTLKLSPADAMRTAAGEKQEQSVLVRACTPADAVSKGHQRQEQQEAVSPAGNMLHGDHTQRSMTRSALLSALDHSPYTPQQQHQQQGSLVSRDDSSPRATQADNNAASPSFSADIPTGIKKASSPSSPQAYAQHHDHDGPLTPSFLAPAARLGETGFTDDDRSRTWSECSFTNAVFSPDPDTPAVAQESRGGNGGGGGGGGGGGNTAVGSGGRGGVARGGVAEGEEGQGARATPTLPQRRTSSPPASEIAYTRDHTATAHTAYTPAAVSALVRMGGRSLAAETPGSGTAANRYRGFIAQSPIALSATAKKEDPEEGEAEVPSTPAAAATLAAMMKGASAGVRGSDPAAAAAAEEQGVTTGKNEDFASQEASEARPRDVKNLRQRRTAAPETPSRREGMSAGLPMITPRRRKAASQLLDLSKATPRGMIRGLLSGNGHPAQALQNKHQSHQRFVPQVAKLVENVEEETPRALLKGGYVREDNRSRGKSTSVAEAAAAAAAAAAATAAAAVAAAGSADGAGGFVEGREAGDTSAELVADQAPRSVLAHPGAAAPSPPSAASVAVVHHGVSAMGAGRVFVKVVLVLILLALLCGALVVVADVVVFVCLAFTDPTPTQPIY